MCACLCVQFTFYLYPEYPSSSFVSCGVEQGKKISLSGLLYLRDIVLHFPNAFVVVALREERF